MPTKRVLITQSNYIPWKGYFDAIAFADEFILLDDVQYTSRDWRSRNSVKTRAGVKWLSIPIKHIHGGRQAIDEVEIADSDWARKHWAVLEQSYTGAPHFAEYREQFAVLYERASRCTHLSEVNLLFLREICRCLEIETPFRSSRAFQSNVGKTERLVSICKQTSATHYLTGPRAKNYLQEKYFRDCDIQVVYLNFENYPPYPQLHGKYVSEVSILDLLFCTGAEAPKFMKYATLGSNNDHTM